MNHGRFAIGSSALLERAAADRMRSLLSVVDMVRELHAVLEAAGEWDNTFVIFSSAHLPRLASHRSVYYCLCFASHRSPLLR